MKYIRIAILLLLLGTGLARAHDVARISVTDLEIERTDADLTIDFTVVPKDVEVKSISELTIVPEVVSFDSSRTLDLPSVVVAGRSRWLIRQRESESKRPATLLRAGKSDPYRYHVKVPYEQWMAGATINFRESVTGCKACPEIHDVIPVALLDIEPPEEQKKNFADYYIQPKAEAVKTRHLEGQAYVDFPVNKIEIYPDYRRNTVELAKIIASIDTVKNDPDCTVSSVTLKGYASPEGSYANNTRLAKGRTNTLSDYVRSFYNFPASIMATSYDPEDWGGLRRWLESATIENKDAILAIVDSDMEPDAKDLKIKKTYPVQYAYLLKEVYPGLRHSDYRIEYVIRSFTNPEEIKNLVHTAPQKLSLEEFFVAANACEPGSEEYYEIFETAVRMYPQDETANMNAANSAISRGDYDRAAKYLERAGDSQNAQRLRELLRKSVEEKDLKDNYNPVIFL